MFRTGRLMVFILMIFLGTKLVGEEKDPGLLFEANFDSYGVDADYSRAADGKCSGFPAPDLQLRMFPGVAGKGNALNLANSEFCQYKMLGNFDPRQGTVSLWISPQNWKITEEPWQVFFHAEQKDYKLQIFKVWPGYIIAQYGYDSAPGKAKPYRGSAQIRVNPEEWSAGRWHKLDYVWNENGNKLYLDGMLLPTQMNLIVGKKAVPPSRPDYKFPEPIKFSEAVPGGWFTLGVPPYWQKNKNINPEHRTALDEVKIYNRMLNAAEIRAGYEKFYPPSVKSENCKLNLLTVPQTSGITLDGKIGETEWQDAAMVPIINSVQNAAQLVPGRVSIKTDGQFLYVAFRQEISCKQAEHREPDGKLWEDDSFELHLQSPDKQDSQFIINGNGAIFDQLNLDAKWQSGAKAAAFKGENFWTAEIAIPVAAFGGMKNLTKGDWTANFCASFNDPITRKKNYTQWSNTPAGGFGPSARIKFSPQPNIYRLEKLGDLNVGRLDLALTATPKTSGIIGTATIKAEGWPEQNYPGNIINQAWQRGLNPGQQTLSLEVKNGSQEVFFYEQAFAVNRPLEIKHDADPTSGIIKVGLDFSNAGAAAAQRLSAVGIAGNVMLLNAADKAISKADFTAKSQVSQTALPLPKELTQGEYRIQVKTIGTDTAFSSEIPFRMPDTAPYQLKIALDHTVPLPWTPIKKVSDTIYQVLDREYQFDGRSPFPKQIISRGEKVIDRTPQLVIDLGDGAQAPVWSKAEVKTVQPDRVDFAGIGELGKLTVEWTAQLHFDGMYLFRFELKPAGTVKINQLTMNWSVPATHAKFFLNPLYVPWQDNRAESNLLPNAKRKDNVLWLSGDEKGLMWWCESNANWANKPQENPIIAVRNTNTAEATLKIISVPVELKQKAAYTMAFMATPSRRPTEEFRANNNGFGWGRSKGCNIQYISGGNFNNAKYGDDLTWSYSLIPQYPDEFDKSLKTYIDRGIKPVIYNMPGFISDWAADYDYLGRAGENLPGNTGSYTKLGRPWTNYKYCGKMAGALVADLWAYNLDQLLTNHPDCAGLYYDCGSVEYCSNPRHGCGGVDAFGKHYISSEALGLREIYLRTYKVAKKHGADKAIMIHSHIQFNPMAHGFCDYWVPGENTFQLMVDNPQHGYCEGIALEAYQSDYNWRNKGVMVTMLAQTGRVADCVPAFKKYKKEFTTDPKYAYSALAAFLVHDFNVMAAYISYEIVEKWWTTKSAVNLGKAKDYHGYWVSDAVKSSSPKVLTGWYEWDQPMPYSRMLVISNFNREDQPAALTLDKKAMGIEGKPVKYYDVWNDGKELSEADLATAQVKGNNFMLIGIK